MVSDSITAARGNEVGLLKTGVAEKEERWAAATHWDDGDDDSGVDVAAAAAAPSLPPPPMLLVHVLGLGDERSAVTQLFLRGVR